MSQIAQTYNWMAEEKWALSWLPMHYHLKLEVRNQRRKMEVEVVMSEVPFPCQWCIAEACEVCVDFNFLSPRQTKGGYPYLPPYLALTRMTEAERNATLYIFMWQYKKHLDGG